MSSRLHVAISVLTGVTGGPATYGRRLCRALTALEDPPRITVLTDRPAAFAELDAAVVEVPTRGGIDRLRWQHVALPKEIGHVAPDVYHDTKNALPRGLRGPAVVTVHDLAYWAVPETFGLLSRMFLRRATKDAVRRARVVVVPSRATREDVARFLPDAASKVRVVPHGIDPAPEVDDARRAEVRARLGLPERYVLHVGTIQARKNVDLVVRGVRALRAEGLPHRVVVVGRRGWLAERAIAEIERDDTALWLGVVSADDLAVIYACADAFVSPSAYEGFGFTVADALAAGTPTVIADASSLPEVCGDAAVRLRELSAEAVTEALGQLLRDDARRVELSARGRARAAGFRWADAAAGHLAAYRAALA